MGGRREKGGEREEQRGGRGERERGRERRAERILLQVHRSTSNNACQTELGRFPLLLTVQKKALTFWAHKQPPSLTATEQ
ncbi:hypothetical protein FKM82_017462 [Ascaphus truei]